MGVVATRPVEIVVNAEMGTFEADCLSGDALGDIVYRSSATAVEKCDISNASKMPAIGIIVEKPSSTRCKVRTLGTANVYTALNIGKAFFVGSDARPSLTRPTPGIGQLAYLQGIGKSSNATTVIVSPDNYMTVIRG